MEYTFSKKYEDYYTQFKIDVRKRLIKQILDEANPSEKEERKDEDCNNILLLHSLRYDLRENTKNKKIQDYYIRAIVLLNSLRGSVKKKKSRADIIVFDEAMECFDLKGLEDAINTENKSKIQAYYNEFVNAIGYYITLCKSDNSYGTSFFGLMRLKEDKVKSKIAEELKGIFYDLMEFYPENVCMPLLQEASQCAFNKVFLEKIDYRDLLKI